MGGSLHKADLEVDHDGWFRRSRSALVAYTLSRLCVEAGAGHCSA